MRRLLWVMLLWGAGCSGEEEALSPQAGMWSYDQEGITYGADGCRLEGTLVFIDVIIDQVEAEGFRYIDTNGDALACSLSGSGAFACVPLEELIDYSGSGADAVLTFTTEAEGALSSATALSRSVRIAGTCEGSDCDGLFSSVSFPCETTAEMTATYTGPAEELDTAFGQ